MEKWLYMSFNLIKNVNFIPEIKIDTYKEKKQIAAQKFKAKPFYTFGCLPLNDL